MSEKDDNQEQFEFSDSEFEISRLKKEILELETLVQRMKQVITDNELQEELKDIDFTSDSEQICVTGISQILDLVEKGVASDSDIKNFDILYKNLRLVRGQEVPSGKGKKLKTKNVAELISIVKGK